MIDREGLAKIVIDLRKKKGYSQRKLAIVSGLSNSTISRIESSSSDTDPETLNRLAPYLNTTYEILMEAAGYIQIVNNLDEAKFSLQSNKTSLGYIHKNEISDLTLYTEEDKHEKDKYPEVNDVEEAIKIILEQPGLMLKGEILSGDSKIILANAIQMGLKTAEELERKKSKGDKNE